MTGPATESPRLSGSVLADRALEAAYREEAREGEQKVVSWAWAVTAVNVLAFAVTDPRFVQGPALGALLGGRVGYCAALLAAFFALRRTRSAIRRDAIHAATVVVLLSLMLGIAASRPRTFYHAVSVDLVIVYGIYAVYPMRIAHRAALAVAATTVTVVTLAAWRDPLHPMAYATFAAVFATMHALGLFVAHDMDRSRRIAWARGREAEAASRAKTLFLGVVSHEILSPLAGLVAAAEAIARSPGGIPDDTSLASLRVNGADLKAQLTAVLDLARGEATEPDVARAPTSVRGLLSDVEHALIARARERGVALRVGADAAVPAALSLDGRALHRVLLNLVANALRFTARGHVSVRATAAPAGAGAVDLTVEVEDTGAGIPAEQLPRVFEPFWQGDAAPRQGAGLGLALSRRLVERMGGRLDVRSAVGAGSTFTVRLESVPVADAAPAPVAPRRAAPAPVSADSALVEEALALAEVPHASRARAFADRVEASAREAGDPALAAWAMEIRSRATALDAAGLVEVLRRLGPRDGAGAPPFTRP